MGNAPQDPRRLIARLAVAIMVADGCITASERDALERFDRLGLGPLAALAEDEIRRAMQHPIDVRGTSAALSSLSPEAAAVILAALAELAASDGPLAPREMDVLEAIAGSMGLTAGELGRVLNSAIGITGPAPQRATQSPIGTGEASIGDRTPLGTGAAPAREGGRTAVHGEDDGGSDDELARALRVLGLYGGADDTELEAAYRELVERYNPAKVVGLGAEFAALAVRKLVAVTSAYERVRAALAHEYA